MVLRLLLRAVAKGKWRSHLPQPPLAWQTCNRLLSSWWVLLPLPLDCLLMKAL